MSYPITLAEIETYVRKAARACGLDWGIAEEAGKAARWLAAFDLPGPELMLAHLTQLRGKSYQPYIPDCDSAVWQAQTGVMCPIITGAALADRSAQLLSGPGFELGGSAYPLLLVATVGQAARRHRHVFTLAWRRVRCSCFEDGLSIHGNADDLLLAAVDSVSCVAGGCEQPQRLPSTSAYAIDETSFRQIDELAFKTYVPATETSRAGAGAGLTDND